VVEHVQGHTTDQGQVSAEWSVRVRQASPKLHVQDPVLLIFDAPVLAHRGRKPVPLCQRAQEVAAFGAGFFPMIRVDSTWPTAWSPAQSGLASSQSI